MNITPISFGKKIPIMKCNIKDTEENKNIPATISEYDCQTSEEANDVFNVGYDWHFHINIGCAMQMKYEQNLYDEESSKHFYVTEDNNGCTVALCETEEKNNEIAVLYVESIPDSKYKYCGKTMLAALGKKLIKNNGDKLTIPMPLDEAYDFYVKGCGFKKTKEDDPYYLEMNQRQINKFISETELQTGEKIL